MRCKRSAFVVAAFVLAVASPVLPAASASVVGAMPWTQQTVFALGPSGTYVAEWMGVSQRWSIIGGPASHVYAGSAGVFATDPSGDIFEYDGTPDSWTQIGGPGVQFAEGDGHLYGLGPNSSYVAEWNGSGLGWTIIGGPASQIHAGPFGLVATGPSGSSEDIWRYNGTPNDWTDIGEYGDVAVGAGAVYRINPVNAAGVTVLDEWTGGSVWTPILAVGGGDELVDLIAGYDGVYVDDVVGTTGEKYLKYSGTPNNWSPVTPMIYHGDGMFPAVESSTNLFGVTLSSSRDDDFAYDVDVYSGSGTSWTMIGGAADPELAAGD